MTQDEIIEMARQAGFSIADGIVTGGVTDVKRFAKLVAEKEREACEELKACVKSFFEDYLNMRECSDSGRMWAPIAVSCARVMKLDPLGELLERMRVLSGAEKAHDEQ